MSETPRTSSSTDCREGITIPAKRVMPGDLLRVKGVLRTVSHLEHVDGDDTSFLVHFLPSHGLADKLRVMNDTQIYVRRVCSDQ